MRCVLDVVALYKCLIGIHVCMFLVLALIQLFDSVCRSHQFYYMFGFLFFVAIILVITCSEATVLLCYFHLCAEVCKGQRLGLSLVRCSSKRWYLKPSSCLNNQLSCLLTTLLLLFFCFFWGGGVSTDEIYLFKLRTTPHLTNMLKSHDSKTKYKVDTTLNKIQS